MANQRFKQTEIGMIPEDWDVKTVDNIKDLEKKSIISGPFGSNIGSRFFVDSGVPVIRGNNLSSGMTKFIDKGFVFLTKEKADELKTWAKRQDLIFTAAGTIGQVGIIPEDSKYNEYIISNKQLRLRVDCKKVLPLFIFYWFSSPPMVAHIKQRNTGSTIPLINLSTLKSLPLPRPSLTEQKAIAHILSTLDEKIELLQKQNKTLEEIGQAIFKKWFIDNPEKGGWEESTIGEKLKIVLGGTPSRIKPEYWGGDINWINSGKVNEFRITEPSEKITEEGLRKSATSLLPAGTVVIAITGATLGQVSKLEIDSCANQSVIGILEDEKFSSPYIYYWINNQIGDIIGHQTGGAQQHINKGNIDNYPLLIPDETILKEFNLAIAPIFNKVSNNCFSIQTLSQIRDSLLPKLMSGKIRVPLR